MTINAKIGIFLLCYILIALGKSLPMTFIETYGATPLHLFELGGFSWFISLILLQVLQVFRKNRKRLLTRLQEGYLFRLVCIVILCMQSLWIIHHRQVHLVGWGGLISDKVPIFCILLAGACLEIYLYEWYLLKGIGGIFVLFLPQRLVSLSGKVLGLFSDASPAQLATYSVFLILLGFLTLLSSHAYLKVPVVSLSLPDPVHNQLSLPLLLNPIGGIPIIYLTMFTSLLAQESMTVSYYMLGLVVFSLLQAMISPDYYSLTQGMQQSGEYVAGVAPGKSTFLYLSQRGMLCAGLGIGLLVGSTWAWWLLTDQFETIDIPANLIFVLTIMTNLLDQIKDFSRRKSNLRIL